MSLTAKNVFVTAALVVVYVGLYIASWFDYIYILLFKCAIGVGLLLLVVYRTKVFQVRNIGSYVLGAVLGIVLLVLLYVFLFTVVLGPLTTY